MYLTVSNSKTLVLGATGMLGSQVLLQLEKQGIHVVGTTRNALDVNQGLIKFSAGVDSIENLLDKYPDTTHVVNAIGIIKPHINEQDPKSVLNAININSVFPFELAQSAEKRGIKVIQIATDCVYSGSKGSYDEFSVHDAQDVYGKTKSLGEVASPAMMHLRCSIIGREIGRSTSLVEWVLNQPIDNEINGFSNHLWNGVTTNVFGMIAAGIIKSGSFTPGVHHVVPSDVVTKFELVSAIAKSCNRPDIKIKKTDAAEIVDRTITTNNIEFNNSLWRTAGYSEAPKVVEIVTTLG